VVSCSLVQSVAASSTGSDHTATGIGHLTRLDIRMYVCAGNLLHPTCLVSTSVVFRCYRTSVHGRCGIIDIRQHFVHYYAPAPYRAEVLSDAARLTSVCLSVAYIGSNSRMERPRKAKIGTESTGAPHDTRDSDTTFKVKRSKVNLRGRAYCGGLPHSLFIRTCGK